MNRKSLIFTAPFKVEVREDELADPKPGEVQVRTVLSAISAGTELLLYRGEAPGDLPADATISALDGKLSYPLKYGYSAVGEVISIGEGVGAEWRGRRVFALNPHESAFNAKIENLQSLPDEVEVERATFLANAETAVNLVLDGSPRLGERVVVLGQGVVGLFLTAGLARHPLESLISFDNYPGRRDFSLKFGAQQSFDSTKPESKEAAMALLGPRGADLVYELSGQPEALDLAMNLVGEEGRIVVGSWYGSKRAPIDLGGHFHRGRIKLISSQVSHIAPALTGRWDLGRRFEQAWKWLAEIKPIQLVTHRFAIADAAKAYAQLNEKPAETLGILLTYELSSD
jgi:2-desacetyl-2-hydroxyethyl bacteriochlorophyllide A dehydrogenase